MVRGSFRAAGGDLVPSAASPPGRSTGSLSDSRWLSRLDDSIIRIFHLFPFSSLVSKDCMAHLLHQARTLRYGSTGSEYELELS